MALLNLGTTCELMGRADKAIEWHTLVSYVAEGDAHKLNEVIENEYGNKLNVYQLWHSVNIFIVHA